MTAEFTVQSAGPMHPFSVCVCAYCEKVVGQAELAIVHSRDNGRSYSAHEKCARDRLNFEELR